MIHGKFQNVSVERMWALLHAFKFRGQKNYSVKIFKEGLAELS